MSLEHPQALAAPPSPPLNGADAQPIPVRIFWVQAGTVRELPSLPTLPPAQGFLWVACTRAYLANELARIQSILLTMTGQQLVDLHVSDLLNAQLPSHYDYTSQYDVLVLHRLRPEIAPKVPLAVTSDHPLTEGAPVLRNIETQPVGFAVFDQILLSVHPADCSVRDAYAARLLASIVGTNPVSPPLEPRAVLGVGIRLPSSPSDLMLRLASHIVDHFLDLRRELSRQLDHWQTELLKPRTRFVDWNALLDARMTLHRLDEICEDQRAAMQDWVDALETWPPPDNAVAMRERDLLKVRSRDVLEHIERVVHHVRRLEHSTETTVQMHFSVLSNRTNDIMRMLTALTAVFLPLNLIAAIFGMNFDGLPLIHRHNGFWWALLGMGLIAVCLLALFWRKRYLVRTGSSR